MTSETVRGPIVLIHGVGLDHHMWDECRSRLPSSWQVITPDLPGHGAAGVISTRTTTLGELADAVRRSCPLGAHVVGFSLGALIAQRLALDAPDHVRSLTLVSSVARRTPTERDAVMTRLTNARRDPAASRAASISRWTGDDESRLAPAAMAYARSALAAMDHDSFLAAYEVFATADEQLWPALPTITAPTLAITGSADPGSTPRMSADLAEAIPGARAQVVDGARHLLPLERPQVVVDLVLDHVRSHDADD